MVLPGPGPTKAKVCPAGRDQVGHGLQSSGQDTGSGWCRRATTKSLHYLQIHTRIECAINIPNGVCKSLFGSMTFLAMLHKMS